MNSPKPLQWAGLALGVAFGLSVIYSHLQFFGNATFLGGILLIEVLVASLWKYDQRFFVFLMVAFLWAGMNVPLQGAWTGGRWLVLSAGALVGYLVWMKGARSGFKVFHLIALFCVGAAFVSATVSPFMQMASFKALSLLLLFLYCASGARIAVLGREERFFRGLLWGSEIVVYATAICYLGLGQKIWGNPNSLGAAMSIGLFPILLWGWLTSVGQVVKLRRLAALLLCTYLVFLSMERAGMASVVVVALVFFFCLHQYKLLVKVVALVLLLVAVTGMLAPETLSKSLWGLEDAVLYKGNKEKGVLGSRETPWMESIASIKEHPFFGTGYGTSPTGANPGLAFGRFASSIETEREHGSSYVTIVEWTGLLGALPFIMLIGLTALNVGKVCVWMRKTANPYHYSLPLAMVLLAGLIHANFEDWLFAIGSYLSVYFWVVAFMLVDVLPTGADVPLRQIVLSVSRPAAASLAAIAPGQ